MIVAEVERGEVGEAVEGAGVDGDDAFVGQPCPTEVGGVLPLFALAGGPNVVAVVGVFNLVKRVKTVNGVDEGVNEEVSEGWGKGLQYTSVHYHGKWWICSTHSTTVVYSSALWKDSRRSTHMRSQSPRVVVRVS